MLKTIVIELGRMIVDILYCLCCGCIIYCGILAHENIYELSSYLGIRTDVFLLALIALVIAGIAIITLFFLVIYLLMDIRDSLKILLKYI